MVSFSIASLFCFLGLWVVLPFSGLEMILLGSGLYFTSRKSYQQEVITINKRKLIVEKGCCKVLKRWQFDTYWVRVNLMKNKGLRDKLSLYLGSHGKYIEIGKFLNNKEKESLAFEMNRGILIDGFYK
jgi:uncharacterized membrane protein